MRIADALNSPPIEARQLIQIQRETKSIDVEKPRHASALNQYEPRSSIPSKEARESRILGNYSSMSLKKNVSLFERRLEENYVRVSTIFEKRQKKEQIVL